MRYFHVTNTSEVWLQHVSGEWALLERCSDGYECYAYVLDASGRSLKWPQSEVVARVKVSE